MADRRPGGQTVLTPEIHDRIITAVRAGAPLHFAAGIAGVRRETVWRWIQRAEKGRSPYKEFADAFEQARSSAVVRNMAHIQKAAQGDVDRPGDWRAAAWFLERSFPGDFARKDSLEVTGDPDNPVEVNVTGQVNANVTVTQLVDEDRAAAVIAALVEAGVFPDAAMGGVEFVPDDEAEETPTNPDESHRET